MARQIRISFGPNSFSSSYYQNFAVTHCAVALTKNSSEVKLYSTLSAFSQKQLARTVFSPLGGAIGLVNFVFGPNSFSTSVAAASIYATNACVNISGNLETNVLVSAAVAGYYDGNQVVVLVAPVTDIAKKIEASVGTNAINTVFYTAANTYSGGIPIGVFGTIQRTYALSTSRPVDYFYTLPLALVAPLLLKYVSAGFGAFSEVVKKIQIGLVPNSFSSSTVSNSLVPVSYSSQLAEGRLLGIVENLPMPETTFILLNGPGYIDKDGVWHIPQSEFETYSTNTGFAFAKVLITGAKINASVQRIFLYRKNKFEFVITKELLPKEKASEEAKGTIQWIGPTTFETPARNLFTIDLKKYVKLPTAVSALDILVASGPGYVHNNVYYFIPAQPGRYEVQLDILDLVTGQNLVADLTLYAVDTKTQNSLVFNIYEEEGTILKLPVELLIGSVENPRYELISSTEKVALVDGVLHINCLGQFRAVLRVYSAAKSYFDIEVVRS
ncbi:MAG: hypothetical protein QXE80_03390 [Pyrobaculum sp.]